ncbi:hypothetical protein H072_787 [Dactylellina haptotyla CBS 200.50]|uniref:NADP-dependent oxidoreductase domain-containing protein n=1 Tax=Dactylellina haptotyla (strain CBS 200.50) TaxID=1284197 RepID=S8CBU3_DACHA|nr:hypothetical protein H072_787 [Dactylellina haptotyla CBS 200.50]
MVSTENFPSIQLSTGGAIPLLAYGLGTANFKSGSTDVDKSIIADTKTAILAGFTHLDGAENYGNEEELGIAIKESGVLRSKLFVTTKVYRSISSPKTALAVSLKKLDIEYVDLYLIHAPFWDEQEKGISIEKAWQEMEELHGKGLAKAIGVSNFGISEFERIAKIAKIQPAINQIEYNAYLQSPELMEYHHRHGIATAAYGPLIPITKGTPGPLDTIIEELAKKYSKTPTQILLRWAIETGVVAITTSSKEWRMKEALGVGEFKLDESDVEDIRKAGSKKHMRIFWTKNYRD